MVGCKRSTPRSQTVLSGRFALVAVAMLGTVGAAIALFAWLAG
jgi:hypothetical protein